eukprot:GHVS01070170.1.p2 GENE.GHVS01070170.1~~GHVS01070170.1.p2  ORF type:complete len:129 (+),score=30.34 GHVS01070170.1:113-499(+)
MATTATTTTSTGTTTATTIMATTATTTITDTTTSTVQLLLLLALVLFIAALYRCISLLRRQTTRIHCRSHILIVSVFRCCDDTMFVWSFGQGFFLAEIFCKTVVGCCGAIRNSKDDQLYIVYSWHTYT